MLKTIKQRKTITIANRFVDNSNAMRANIYVPFKCHEMILKSISVVLPGNTNAAVKADGIYLVKTNILPNDDTLYHFVTTFVKFNDNTDQTYAITSHSDTAVHFQLDGRVFNGTYEFSIDNLDTALPTNIAAMGQIGLCMTLEFIEFE
jgi:hypothetical protein